MVLKFEDHFYIKYLKTDSEKAQSLKYKETQ